MRGLKANNFGEYMQAWLQIIHQHRYEINHG